MIQINLIPDVKQELLKAQRMRAMVVSISIITSIVSVAVVVLLLVYVYGVQFGRTVYLDNQIKNKAAELAQVEDLSRMVTIQNQLGTISSLNDQKTVSSRLFDVLSAVLPPEPNSVKISQVDINTEEKTIRLEGQTRGFDSMEVFKKTIASAVVALPSDTDAEDETADPVPLASDINTSDVSFGEDSDGNKVLRFVITFAYIEDLFSSKFDTVSIKLSVNGNVTDSYLGLPKSIFTEPAKDIEGKE